MSVDPARPDAESGVALAPVAGSGGVGARPAFDVTFGPDEATSGCFLIELVAAHSQLGGQTVWSFLLRTGCKARVCRPIRRPGRRARPHRRLGRRVRTLDGAIVALLDGLDIVFLRVDDQRLPCRLHGQGVQAYRVRVPQSAFDHFSVHANGIVLHYAAAGAGEPVILIGGWPQTWLAWRHVVPLLAAARRRVIVLDPRGLGDSDKPADGYDLDTLVDDVHRFIGALDLASGDGVDIVSHDVGSWISFALAVAHPADLRRLVLSEMTVQTANGRRPVPDDRANVASWHFAFNRLAGLPEALVEGRERLFLDWMFDNKAKHPETIDADAREHYTRSFAAPGAAHAGFEYYRALMSERGLERLTERLAHGLTMPVLTIGASDGVGTALADQLRDCAPLLQGVVLEAGHYLPEEAPTAMVDAILAFWTSTDVPGTSD